MSPRQRKLRSMLAALRLTRGKYLKRHPTDDVARRTFAKREDELARELEAIPRELMP